jgi:hypothetical protein
MFIIYLWASLVTVVVSLYAVNHDLNDKIKQWFKEERLGGMPIFPDRYRLDSVVIEIY